MHGNIENACNIFDEYKTKVNNNPVENKNDIIVSDWMNHASAESIIAYLFFTMGRYKDAELYYKKASRILSTIRGI